ncbi:putative encoded peptide [Medicago truncatula]|uniref:Putative encoded peptide n=1 Tax=Medicago truncatula TaxID=3880 RepID=A0A396GUG1_MEDTR|nr:putative encoded peptide [Medicago truncatula]
MGEFQAMQKYFAIFLVLVAYHIFLPTQARKIKPLIEDNPKPTFTSLKTAVNIPSPTFEKKVNLPMMPNHGVASIGDSSGDTNAFRPTTPGSSPGVGHRKFVGEVKDSTVVRSPNVKVFVTSERSKDAFKPTYPNHSPGVGHVNQSTKGQLN